jgi:hypothetical protein
MCIAINTHLNYIIENHALIVQHVTAIQMIRIIDLLSF